LFFEYQQAAKAVDAKSIAAGLSSGTEIQAAVHRARLDAIKTVAKHIQA